MISRNRDTTIDVLRLSLMGIAAILSWIGVWRYFAPYDVIVIVATLVGGYPVYIETFQSLRHGRINMEVSMTLAIAATLLTEQFVPAVVITLFVLLSEYIETYATDRGRATIVKLEKSIPRMALVRRNGMEVEADLSSIKPDEIVIVRDGERIPVDGVVVAGSGFVNQAAITGEAMSVDKTVGSGVYAGSVNESGLLEVRTIRVGGETVFGKIIKLVEEAENRKAPIQKISDRLATLLVEFTIVFAGVTFFVTRNLSSTISVIVVAGACGVAAGTPLAIVAIMGGLAKRGVVVKGGSYIQEMSRIDTVVIDKTGTLTFGEPEVTELASISGIGESQKQYKRAADRLQDIVKMATRRMKSVIDPDIGDVLDQLKATKVNILNMLEFTERQANAAISYYLEEILDDRKRATRLKSGEQKVRFRTPVICAIEEAHAFIPSEGDSDTKYIASKVAREGRKFGISLIAVSQRPRRLDQDVLSQMGSLAIMKLTNPEDQSHIREASEAISENLLGNLPSLNVGEAVLLGDWVSVPSVVKIDYVKEKKAGADVSATALWAAEQKMKAVAKESTSSALKLE